jgi:hypothetical protein
MVTAPSAGVGRAQLGLCWVDSFDCLDSGRLRGSMVGDDKQLQYYTMAQPSEPEQETCDVCGSTELWWRNCKLLCRRCGSIVKSCADL